MDLEVIKQITLRTVVKRGCYDRENVDMGTVSRYYSGTLFYQNLYEREYDD